MELDASHIGIILSTVTIMLTIVVTVLKGGLYIRDKISEATKNIYGAIKDHEIIDNDRHDENLDRFTAIKEQLARVETKQSYGFNGNHDRR